MNISNARVYLAMCLACALPFNGLAQERGPVVTGNSGPVLSNNSVGGNLHLTINQGWDINRAPVAQSSYNQHQTWQEAASAVELLNKQLASDREFSSFLLLLTGATGVLHVENSLKQLDASVEKGSSMGAMVSALSYWNGWWGRQTDLARGRKLFELAAERGSPGGQIFVGDNLWNGANGFPKDPVRANQYLVRLVNNENALRHTRAIHATYLGNRYLQGGAVPKDECLGIRFMAQAAALGGSEAMRTLGHERESHTRCLPVNKAEALSWFEKGALAGDGNSAFQAGRMHHFGLAKERDYVSAERYYLMSATPYSDGMLSWVYAKGLANSEGRADLGKAFAYARKAVDGGDSSSMVQLGLYYELGTGVQQNVQEAFRWYGKASQEGILQGKVNQAALIQQGCVGPEQMPSWVEDLSAISESSDSERSPRARALNLLGLVYFLGTSNVPTDKRKALSYFDRSCKLGFIQGCENYVAQNAGGSISKEARAAAEKARSQGAKISGDACRRTVAEFSADPDTFP
jgi:TPR repeat protein